MSILSSSLLLLHVQANETNKLYFTDTNINYIQSKLIQYTKQQTGQQISKQNCNDVLQAMQYFYANYPQLTINDITARQNVEQLNDLVIRDLLSQIVSNVKQYLSYIKDINSSRTLLEYGAATSIKGTY